MSVNLYETEPLRKKTLRGVSWSFIDNIASSGIIFLVGLILARILSPEEFGLIGMITIFIAVSNSIIDSGFSSALIRKNNIQNRDYTTVFLTNLAVSILLYSLLYISAPIISRFYNVVALISITRAIGLVLIFNAFGIVQRTILVKEIDFKTQAKVSVLASVGSGVIGIIMALNEFGVWSLVMQQLSRQFLSSLFLWVFSKWTPKWEFSIQSFTELFGFGSKLMLSGIISTTFQHIYYLIIGKFYNSYLLGQYTRAEQFKNIFSQNLTSIIQRVSYPALSSIQDQAERLRNAYKKIIKISMLVTFACMLGMAAIAKPLIFILIGEKWEIAVIYLQIMCFAGMLYPLHAINLNMLQVKGRSDLFLKLEIYKKLLILLPVSLGIVFGIEYLLIGSVFNSFISYLLNSYYSGIMINYSSKQQLIDIFPTFAIALATSFVMWLISFLPLNIWLILIVQVSIGLLLGGILYERTKLPEYIEVKTIIISFTKDKIKWLTKK